MERGKNKIESELKTLRADKKKLSEELEFIKGQFNELQDNELEAIKLNIQLKKDLKRAKGTEGRILAWLTFEYEEAAKLTRIHLEDFLRLNSGGMDVVTITEIIRDKLNYKEAEKIVNNLMPLGFNLEYKKRMKKAITNFFPDLNK